MNRVRRPRRGQQLRGFTVLELAVSMAVFAMIAGVVTLAVARAQLTVASARLEQSVRAELATLVATTSTAQYTDVVDGTYSRPNACPQDATRSCVSVLGRNFTVSWDVSAADDLAGVSQENPSAVLLRAATTLPGNRPVAFERVLVSPNAGRDGTTGVLRVRGDGAAYDGPVFLLRPPDGGQGETGEQVVASGAFTAGTAQLRADATQCTTTAPCRLALAPDGSTRSGDVTLDASSTVGERASIALTADATTEAGITFRAVPQVRVGLLAAGPDGRRGVPTQRGSVCLWLSGTDGATDIAVPACNADAASTLLFTTYQPDAARPQIEVALPAGSPLALSTDSPSGDCPDLTGLGQRTWNGGTWEASDECTSHTWGPAASVVSGRDPGASPTPIATARLYASATPTEYQAVWSGTTALPAAGLSGENTWAFPRDARGCSGSGACSPVTTNLEASCPVADAHCTSGGPHAPSLARPASTGAWSTHGVYAPVGTDVNVTVRVLDPDGDAVTVTAVSAPAGLSTVTYDAVGSPEYTPVNGGQEIATVNSGDSIQLAFRASGPLTAEPFTLTLTDSGGATTEEVITFWNTRAPWKAVPSLMEVRQGASGTLSLTAIDQAGDPAGALTGIQVVPSAGLTVGAWTASGAGTLSSTVRADQLEPGWYPIDFVSADGVVQHTASVHVLATAGDLTVEATGGAQGDAGTITAAVTDLTGAPMPGADVAFTVTSVATGKPALGVYASPRGCRTGASGTCAVELTIESAASPGAYAVTATTPGASGALTSTAATVTITSTVTRLSSSGVVVSQGATAAGTVSAADGGGNPAPGVQVVATGAPAGMTVAVADVTDAAGQAQVSVTAAATVPAGTYTITLDGGPSTTMRVSVRPVVASVTAGYVYLPQGGFASATLTALDGAGDPVSGVPLSVESPAAGANSPVVQANATAVTGANGQASVSVSATADSPRGQVTLPVFATGVATQVGTVPVVVVQGVSSLVLSGTLTRGQAATVTLIMRDADGLPVPSRPFTLDTGTSDISPRTGSSTTGALGSAELVLTAANTASTGLRAMSVQVDGRTIPVGVIIR